MHVLDIILVSRHFIHTCQWYDVRTVMLPQWTLCLLQWNMCNVSACSSELSCQPAKTGKGGGGSRMVINDWIGLHKIAEAGCRWVKGGLGSNRWQRQSRGQDGNTQCWHKTAQRLPGGKTLQYVAHVLPVTNKGTQERLEVSLPKQDLHHQI